jgi:D-alanine-D-alanine ligase
MTNKRVVILHEPISASPREDEEDLFIAIESVRRVLQELDYQTTEVPFSLNLEKAAKTLLDSPPLFVFNLVETVADRGGLSFLACALLERLQLSFTGNPSPAMFLTSNKIVTKKLLSRFLIPTPPWVSHPEDQDFIPGEPYIIKPISEDASIGLDQESLLHSNSYDSLRHLISRKAAAFQTGFFAEKYIEGREFNVSLLGSKRHPHILPIAEMHFQDYAEKKLVKILDYDSKWNKESFQYHHTIPHFDFPQEDQLLVAEINRLVLQCWSLFELNGYARIDLRVDAQGRPWVIEINANPCLSPDSGLVMAADRAGLSYRELIRRITAALNEVPYG